MVKFVIVNDNDKNPEPVLRLKLKSASSGNGVFLDVVDEWGKPISTILTITELGFYRNKYVNPGLGLPLDTDTRVMDETAEEAKDH